MVEGIVDVLSGPCGLNFNSTADHAVAPGQQQSPSSASAAAATAARLALGSLMAACPSAAFARVQPLLEAMLDRRQYEGITDHDAEVYETPDGVLSSERAQAGQYQVGDVQGGLLVRIWETGQSQARYRPEV